MPLALEEQEGEVKAASIVPNEQQARYHIRWASWREVIPALVALRFDRIVQTRIGEGKETRPRIWKESTAFNFIIGDPMHPRSCLRSRGLLYVARDVHNLSKSRTWNMC